MNLALTTDELIALRRAIVMAVSWIESDDVSDDPELAADYQDLTDRLNRLDARMSRWLAKNRPETDQ